MGVKKLQLTDDSQRSFNFSYGDSFKFTKQISCFHNFFSDFFAINANSYKIANA